GHQNVRRGWRGRLPGRISRACARPLSRNPGEILRPSAPPRRRNCTPTRYRWTRPATRGSAVAHPRDHQQSSVSFFFERFGSNVATISQPEEAVNWGPCLFWATQGSLFSYVEVRTNGARRRN